jgi:hypothetical protein
VSGRYLLVRPAQTTACPAWTRPVTLRSAGSVTRIFRIMDLDGLVVRDGDLVTASGRLVRNQAGDWFEPPAGVAAVGGGPRMIRPVSPVAVRVAGADFDELAGRFDDEGAVEGSATLTGIWSADQLQAQRQASPSPRDAPWPRWVTPPCPAPAGGWSRHGGNLRFDMNDLPGIGGVVTVTVFRPGPDCEVLVVAAADPDAAEVWLRPQFGARLCVVASKWTTAELDAVRAQLHARHRAWNLLQLGPSTGEDGQACIAAKLTRVSPEIALWAARLPAGIVSVDPWLRPAHLLPSAMLIPVRVNAGAGARPEGELGF